MATIIPIDYKANINKSKPLVKLIINRPMHYTDRANSVILIYMVNMSWPVSNKRKL